MSKRLFLLLSGAFLVSFAVAQPASLSIGSPMPAADHTVQTIGGSEASVSSLLGAQGTVFIFWSNSCQWTEGYESRVKQLHQDAQSKGIAVVLVNSNDSDSFPSEAPESSAAKGYQVTYVHDTGAGLAKAFGAFRTPEVFAFGSNRTLVYSGAIDDAPADAGEVQNSYVGAFLSGEQVAATKPFGCRIRFPSG